MSFVSCADILAVLLAAFLFLYSLCQLVNLKVAPFCPVVGALELAAAFSLLFLRQASEGLWFLLLSQYLPFWSLSAAKFSPVAKLFGSGIPLASWFRLSSSASQAHCASCSYLKVEIVLCSTASKQKQTKQA